MFLIRIVAGQLTPQAGCFRSGSWRGSSPHRQDVFDPDRGRAAPHRQDVFDPDRGGLAGQPARKSSIGKKPTEKKADYISNVRQLVSFLASSLLALALAEILVELPELESNSAERETWWGPI